MTSPSESTRSHSGGNSAAVSLSSSLQSSSLQEAATTTQTIARYGNHESNSTNNKSTTKTAVSYSDRLSERAMAMHLILCSPFSMLATNIQQPDTSNISTDREFFHALSTNYQAQRCGILRRVFSLRALTEVRFLQIELLNTNLAEIRNKDAIPPLNLCARNTIITENSNLYTYNPVPWAPPIGKETLMHLMKHPQAANDQISPLFERVPRKLHHKLEVCAQRGYSMGWGLQYVEGVSTAHMFIAGLVCCMASTVVGVVYAVKLKDIQGAFAIAAYVTMTLIFLLGSTQALLDK